MNDKPIVFISCGQYTDEERDLGNAVAELVRAHTPYEPYFAEQQNTLEGLVSNILNNLARAAGFIAVMHHRGVVNTLDGTVTRGSIWIEQELAIAAFMEHALKRKIQVALYLQTGIDREGIRQQLRLKPVEFSDAKTVLDDLRTRLQSWALNAAPSHPLIALWSFKPTRPYESDRHEYRLNVALKNISARLIDQWRADIWFPSAYLMNRTSNDPITHFIFDDTMAETEKRIWPNMEHPLTEIDYFVDQRNWPGWTDSVVPKVRFRVSTADAEPFNREISFMD